MKRYMVLVLLVGVIVSCTPQANATQMSPTPPQPTQTFSPATVTTTFTALPTDTLLPTSTASPVPTSCVEPVNPARNATVPARGPFDFTWTAFTGATSYVISIGPADWYPTNFPVNGTTLTRFMENFPSSPNYEWSITAMNSAGQEICKAGPFTFVMSLDVSATASFDSGVAVTSNTGSSSGAQQNSSKKKTNNGGNGTSNSSGSDTSIMIVSDGDDAQCRLSVIFKVKSNQEFTFFKLIYKYDGKGQSSVDFTTGPLDPYPAYNYYNATTPPLSAKNGDTVNFGVWYKTTAGEESKGFTLLHTMTNCSQ